MWSYPLQCPSMAGDGRYRTEAGGCVEFVQDRLRGRLMLGKGQPFRVNTGQTWYQTEGIHYKQQYRIV
jgi:hypothetical protein